VTPPGAHRRPDPPAGARQRDDAPDRLAEEVVEEQDLRRLHDTAGENVDDRLPSLSEQMAEQLGGWRGLLESSIPIAVFVLVNIVWGLYPAIAGSVLTAVAIAAVRLARRQPVRHAINGLLGIAVGAFLAYRSGDAKDFYLPGILLAFGQAAVLLGSVAVGKPLVGYVWAIIAAGGKHDWLANGRLYRTFQWLTVAWAVSLMIRGGVQGLLFLADLDNLLGVARIGPSWPMYIGMVGLTVWAVRRATRHRAAAAAG
jgi:Protein of unknown function (DUF3159)